jgi:signal transduction histidine kinase
MVIQPVVQALTRDDPRYSLLTMLSHELRTPLTCIAGAHSLLADELGECSSAEASSCLQLIDQGVRRLRRLFDQVSLYVELISEYGDVQFQFLGQLVDLRQVIDSAITEIKCEFPPRAAHLVVKQPTQTVSVMAVETLLRRAVYEVLRNAITYSNDGTTVFVELSQPGHHARLTIRDTGRGIAPEYQQLVWQVLTQAERRIREQQGFGMGLPLAWQITRLHGGEIIMNSQLECGTTVTFQLPTVRPHLLSQSVGAANLE